LSERRKYWSWTAKQKIAIVLAGLRGDRSVKEVCREHQISNTLYYPWHDELLEGGLEALAGKQERQGEWEPRRKVAEMERALGRKTYELEIAGEALGGLGVSVRVARSRRPVAEVWPGAGGARPEGEPAGALLARAPKPRMVRRRPADPIEQANRRAGRGQPDRRLPDGDSVRAAQARPAGQPQAGCCG